MKEQVKCLSVSVISEELQQWKKKGTSKVELVVEEEEEEETSGNPRIITQVLSAITIAWTHVGMGCLFAFSGVTLPQLTNAETGEINLSVNEAALFGSLNTIGAAIGSIGSAASLVRYGQRGMLLASLAVSLCTWILQALSPTSSILLASRFVFGLNMGLMSTATNTFVLEVSHKTYRGMLCSITPIARQFGYLFITSLGTSSLTWRQMSFVCGFVTTFPSFLGLFFLPDSPRWLVTMGRVADAEKSLHFYRGSDYDVSSELSDIVKQVDEQERKKSSFFTQLRLLGNKSTLPKFLTILFISVVSSFNGNFVIGAYLVPIFQSVSSDVNAYTSALIIGSVRVLGTVASLLVVDRVGRRFLMICPPLIYGISLAVLGAYFFADNRGWSIASYGWIPLTSLVCYTFFLSIGIPALPMLRGELLPNSVRAAGSSIIVTSMYTGGFGAVQTYPQVTVAVGEHGAFLIYAGMSILMSVFSFFNIPETRGRSLEEIGETLNSLSSNSGDVTPQSNQ